jgi:hypothetical protein
LPGVPLGPVVPPVSRRGIVPALLFAYQLDYGVIPRLRCSGAEDAVICHQCDFAGCINPAHMWLGTNASNRADTSHDVATWPANWPTSAAPPSAPAPSPRPSEPGWQNDELATLRTQLADNTRECTELYHRLDAAATAIAALHHDTVLPGQEFHHAANSSARRFTAEAGFSGHFD